MKKFPYKIWTEQVLIGNETLDDVLFDHFFFFAERQPNGMPDMDQIHYDLEKETGLVFEVNRNGSTYILIKNEQDELNYSAWILEIG